MKQSIRIMPLGDSITFGINWPGAYRVRLEQLLLNENIVADFVGSQSNGPAELKSKANEGHPGWSIDQLTAQTEGWLNSYKPEVVLLMIGTNDVWVDEPSQVPDVKGAVGKIKDLVALILRVNPTGRIIVSSIPPSGEFWNQYVLQLNLGIKKIVSDFSDRGDALQFADAYASMGVQDLDRDDGMGGVHPSDSGYEKIAGAWLAALKLSY